MNKPVFKERKSVGVHYKKEEASFGRLKRDICLSAETTRPVFEKPDGTTRPGRKQVDVVIARGRARLALTVEEAVWLKKYLEEAIPPAREAHGAVQEEHKAWEARREADREEWKQKLQGNDPRSRRKQRITGKTHRKKVNGKAGEAAHRAKKTEKAQKSRIEHDNKARANKVK